MKLQLGILGCLLAGCVGQPTIVDSPQRGGADGHVAALASGGAFVLRIGIEHLPPDAEAPSDPVPLVESQPRLAPTAPAPAASLHSERRHEPDAAHRHTWALSVGDLSAIDDPIARETLHFVQDLVDTDLERSRREVTMPFLGVHDYDPEGGPLLDSERELLAAQEEWIQQRGPSLMRRPLKKMLKRLPFVEQVEVDFADLRGDVLPITRGELADGRSSFGRLSMRVRVSDLKDPVELAWVISGLRVGSSQDNGRMSLDLDLSDTIRLELRTRYEYATDAEHLRADLAYRPSVTTSLHLSIGDDMDFLSTSSIYSLFETPMDGSPGLVLYAVHLF